jgi:glycosyltransferase involved in cell wall biosynthesis
MPELTVLMPVRDAEAHIGAAIASVLMQTEVNFVLMLLDDGSADGSIAIAESFGDSRIEIVRDGRNLGVAARLNMGLDRTATPFAARMDADDVALPARLARQLAFMRRHPEVGICGSWYRCFSAGRFWDATLPTDHAALSAMTVFNSPFAHPTVMFNMRHLNAAGLRYSPSAGPAEDYDLWERAAGLMTLANIPEFLLHYRVHPGQVSHRQAREQEISAAAVRLRALRRRGVEPSPGQLRIHHDYCATAGAERTRRIDRNYRSLRWLRRLRTDLLRRAAPDHALVAECSRREAALRREIARSRLGRLLVGRR